MQKHIEFSNTIKKYLKLESSPVAISFSNEAPKGVEQMKV